MNKDIINTLIDKLAVKSDCSNYKKSGPYVYLYY